jgi:hypothetical protein
MKFRNRGQQLEAARTAAMQILESKLSYPAARQIVEESLVDGVQPEQIASALVKLAYERKMPSHKAVELSKFSSRVGIGLLEFPEPMVDGVTVDELLKMRGADLITHVRQWETFALKGDPEDPKVQRTSRMTREQYDDLPNSERLTLARTGQVPEKPKTLEELHEKLDQVLNTKGLK